MLIFKPSLGPSTSPGIRVLKFYKIYYMTRFDKNIGISSTVVFTKKIMIHVPVYNFVIISF